MIDHFMPPPTDTQRYNRKPQMRIAGGSGTPPRLRGRGAARTDPLCQDVPIIPVYRFELIVWMKLVSPDFPVNSVIISPQCTEDHMPRALSFAYSA